MATKLGRMVTYLERLLTIKSYNTLIAWSRKVTNKDHYISNTTVFMATKLGRIMSYLNRLLPIKILVPLVTGSC